MLGRSSRLDRAAITINITAITITATVATATAVCFSNNGFPVVVGVVAVCGSAFAPEVSWFVVDTVVVDDNIVEDDIVDDEFVVNVVVSGVDVRVTGELSVVWLDPSVVPFSVVSLSDVVGGDTVVVVVVEVDEDVVVVDPVVEFVVGTCEDDDGSVLEVGDLVVLFGVGVVDDVEVVSSA